MPEGFSWHRCHLQDMLSPASNANGCSSNKDVHQYRFDCDKEKLLPPSSLIASVWQPTFDSKKHYWHVCSHLLLPKMLCKRGSVDPLRRSACRLQQLACYLSHTGHVQRHSWAAANTEKALGAAAAPIRQPPHTAVRGGCLQPARHPLLCSAATMGLSRSKAASSYCCACR